MLPHRCCSGARGGLHFVRREPHASAACTAVIPETERITRVLVRARARRLLDGEPGTGLALGVRNGPTAATVRGDVAPVGTSYAVHTLELSVHPFAGAGRSWVESHFDPTRLVLVFAPADPSNPVRVTQAWMEICTVPKN